MTARGVFCAVAVALVVAAPAARGRQSADDDLIKKARAIHDKAITLDTHVDINPSGFTAERNYTQRLDTQVNLPKMVDGGLDASFFIAYTELIDELFRANGQAALAIDDPTLRRGVELTDLASHQIENVARQNAFA